MKIITKDNLISALMLPIVIFVAVVFGPVLFLIWFGWKARGVWLNIRFRLKWKNKTILYVYSESPNWQQYIEENIAPKINKKSVFINWSKRSEWKQKKPLEAKILDHWGGRSEFNPMAVIFAPKGKVKVVRFHKAFMELKHGKDALLKIKEKELYEFL